MPAVRAREAQLREDFDKQMKVWRDRHDAWEAARRKILLGKGDATSKRADLARLGDEPERPLTPIIVMEEPTIEGLAKLLTDGQPSVGVFSAEGGQFIGGHAMSDDAKLRSSTALSTSWDGGPWKRVRSGDGATTIPDRRVSMHLLVQPDVATQFLNDRLLRDQGLLSQLLVTSPATTMGTRLYRKPSSEALDIIAGFQARLSAAMSLPLPLRPGTRNELMPRRLRLSAEARDEWIAFSDHVERLLGPGGELEPISGFAAKMPEHSARLAAVIAWWRDHRVTEIDADAIAGAIELVQHYAQEHLRLQHASVVPPDIADAQRLLEWLIERWTEPYVSIRDICRFGPNSVRVARRARMLVKILEDHGHLRKVENVSILGQRCREAHAIWGRV